MPDLSAYINAATGEQAAMAATIAVVLFLIGAAEFQRLKPWQSYLRRKAILTANEKEFFYRLLRSFSSSELKRVAAA